MLRKWWWCINHDYASFVDHKHGLISIVGDHKQVITKLLETITFAGINRWPFR